MPPDAILEAPLRRTKTDPARFEVVKDALYSAAEEMKIVLAKTAYSPLLKVAGDYSCGIFDAAGNMVAQGPDLPIHLGSMPDAVRAVIAAFPAVEPDDVFIHNDPYHGGSHLPDVNVVAPAFLDGLLLGFGCVRAHWPDIGSATPGSYGAVTEIYGHRDLRRRAAAAAGADLPERPAQSRYRTHHLRECPHTRGAAGRSPRASRRQPARCAQ